MNQVKNDRRLEHLFNGRRHITGKQVKGSAGWFHQQDIYPVADQGADTSPDKAQGNLPRLYQPETIQ